MLKGPEISTETATESGMKTVIALMLVSFTLPSWATLTSGAQDCPVQFEGKVKEIVEPVGATNFFSMNKVVFENQRTLKGEADDQLVIDVLQNGPFKLEPEKDYRVHLRSGKLCWIEEI